MAGKACFFLRADAVRPLMQGFDLQPQFHSGQKSEFATELGSFGSLSKRADTGTLYRKSSCACGGGCPSCSESSGGLRVSQPHDAAEIEADRTAVRVMNFGDRSEGQISKELTPLIQTKGGGTERNAGPQLTDRLASLQGKGGSLETGARSFLQDRFGADFGDVTIHNDGESARANRDLHSKAFTIGRDIYFNEGEYNPGTSKGMQLLAHELTHTLQQKGSGELGIQKQDDAIEVELIDTPYPEVLDLHNRGIDLPQTGQRPPVRQQNVTHGSAWSLNGRKAANTKRAPGFTGDTSGTYISRIDVQINANSTSTARLRWENMGNSAGFNLPASLSTSPGAGNCATDCSGTGNSQASGSHCTPLSPPDYVVQGFSSHLGSYPSATFVTWYHYDRGVAFHYYDVPAYPASHGCTRLAHSENGAEWIYDNSLPGITIVNVSRNASLGPGPKCWSGGSLIDRPVPRTP